jgi:flagellar biosynthesis protein FliP
MLLLVINSDRLRLLPVIISERLRLLLVIMVGGFNVVVIMLTELVKVIMRSHRTQQPTACG